MWSGHIWYFNLTETESRIEIARPTQIWYRTCRTNNILCHVGTWFLFYILSGRWGWLQKLDFSKIHRTTNLVDWSFYSFTLWLLPFGFYKDFQSFFSLNQCKIVRNFYWVWLGNFTNWLYINLFYYYFF